MYILVYSQYLSYVIDIMQPPHRKQRKRIKMCFLKTLFHFCRLNPTHVRQKVININISVARSNTTKTVQTFVKVSITYCTRFIFILY